MEKDQQYYQMTTEEALNALDSRYEGLPTQEAEKRLEKFGPNEIEAGEKISPLEILIAQIKNPLVYVLVAAAAVSILAGKTVDAIVIGVVIVLNTLIGFFQEYQAEEALESLMARRAGS